ncbi:NAD(P)-dependent oxidoreductase [Alphaproteobacteria bacterium]|nr:NAD(P)-dependent oxidoreductase [Alphaproteobacteria bacterium]
MHRVLLTCPPMIGMLDDFSDDIKESNFEIHVPEFTQEMSEHRLIEIIADYDGWIIGDDPATRQVLETGHKGRLRACMRWGVGTNNVDFVACNDLGIKIENTPGVFGREVADLACHYVSALARDTFSINRLVKEGVWHKPIGRSLWSSSALIIGMGDIGRNIAKRLLSHEMDVYYSDPFVEISQLDLNVQRLIWPFEAQKIDFIILCAPLTDTTFHIFNETSLSHLKKGIHIINVGRGQLLQQSALEIGLQKGIIKSAALDVFEQEPFIPLENTELLKYGDRVIVGSHNGSNTREAVRYVSKLTIKKLRKFLE